MKVSYQINQATRIFTPVRILKIFNHCKIFPTAIKILKKPKDVTSLLGGTATFEVGISEDNIPVKWMFKNQELKQNEHYRMISEKRTHKLIVQDVNNSKEGEYTAIIGHLHCSARLIVECKFYPSPDIF